LPQATIGEVVVGQIMSSIHGDEHYDRQGVTLWTVVGEAGTEFHARRSDGVWTLHVDEEVVGRFDTYDELIRHVESL
jgi:hypothetical protein